MRQITIEVNDVVYALLGVLAKAQPRGSVENIVTTLVDHAQQGVYRPSSWERDWVEQVFPEGWQEHLEPGDPYGRPQSPMFRRPKRA